MKSFFVTGTDTDSGKTYVMGQLLSYFAHKGLRAVGLKPVATGCIEYQGRLVSEDALSIQHYNLNQHLDICQWKFPQPISPHLAARINNQEILVQQIAEYCTKNDFSNHDMMLIEGAGGVMVPINDRETWLDFLQLTAFPVILVVAMRLGCINHALLTDALLHNNKINCVGWIANCLDRKMLYLDENIATLQQKMKMPHLATVGYEGSICESGELFRNL